MKIKRQSIATVILICVLAVSNSNAQVVTEYVHQQGTSFNGKDLEALCKNTSLRKLDLRGASITDKDMVHLSNLKSLEEFRTSHFRLSPKGFAVLKELKNLKVLQFRTSPSSVIKVLEIVKDHPLVELDIHDHKGFTGEGIDVLNCKKTLRKLNISCGRGEVTDRGLESIKEFTALTHLDLNGNATIKTGTQFLENMTNLESLNMYGCVGVKDAAYTSLFKKLKKLKTLNLGFCWAHKGTDLVLPPSIEELNLVESKQLTDAAFKEFPCKPTLVRANLFQCLQLTDKGIAQFEGMPQLKRLNIGCIRALTNASLKSISSNTGLTHLNLSDNDNFDDAGLAHLRNMVKLESLNLWHVKGITGTGLKYLTGMNRLRELNLADCSNLTDHAIAAISTMSSLKSLYLNNCAALTDEAIINIPATIKLRELAIAGCKQLTDRSLAHLRSMGSLEYLDLGGCDQLTDRGIRMIRKALPDCVISR